MACKEDALDVLVASGNSDGCLSNSFIWRRREGRLDYPWEAGTLEGVGHAIQW